MFPALGIEPGHLRHVGEFLALAGSRRGHLVLGLADVQDAVALTRANAGSPARSRRAEAGWCSGRS